MKITKLSSQPPFIGKRGGLVIRGSIGITSDTGVRLVLSADQYQDGHWTIEHTRLFQLVCAHLSDAVIRENEEEST